MCAQSLWGTSSKGNVYRLWLKENEWQQVQSSGKILQGFKKVVGSQQGAWGLGCDQILYVYVDSTDIPVRVQESIWENERWLPIQGWSSKHLLALEPRAWSNQDGSVQLTKDAIVLPSAGWTWDSDWSVDHNVEGFQTDKEGWRYSNIHFYHGFSHKKTFKSCVRRRHWIRTRVFSNTNSWTKAEPLHLDPLEEPITDVALGGHDLPNRAEGALSVWITSAAGALLYRSGVCSQAPLGVSWQPVAVDGEEDVLCVAAGRLSLVWALTCNGAILARLGVTWQNPKGVSWIQVPQPEHLSSSDKIVQVAVGTHSAWVVSAEGRVWLRKGVEPEEPVGTGWLQMSGCLKSVSVGGFDKVFGIDMEDRSILFRGGISPEETSGKSWYDIKLPYKPTSQQIDGSDCAVEIDTISSKQENQQKETQANKTPVCETAPRIDISSPAQDTESQVFHHSQVLGRMQDNFSTELDSELDSLCDEGLENTSHISMAFGRLSFSRDNSSADLNSLPGAADGLISPTSQSTLGKSMLHTENGDNSVECRSRVKEQNQSNSSPSLNMDLDDVRKISDVQKSEASERESEASNSENSNPSTDSHVSFKRLRSFGGHFRNPKSMIDKLKQTKPKEFFQDIKNDMSDQKNHIVSQIKQAQSVILGEKKQQERLDSMTVSFTKGQACQDEEDEESTMSLTFESKQGVAEAGTLSPTQETTSVINPCGSVSDSVSVCSETVSLDSEDPWLQFQAEPEVGDIKWLWVSATSLSVADDHSIDRWLCKGRSVSDNYRREMAEGKVWRNNIIDALRKSAEVSRRDTFSSYQPAIEKVGWSKTGSLQLCPDPQRSKRWVKCGVELLQESSESERAAPGSAGQEQGSAGQEQGSSGHEQGSVGHQQGLAHAPPGAYLTLIYTYRNQEQGAFLDLRDVLCVRRERDVARNSVFSLQNWERQRAGLAPFLLAADTEEQMEDWINQLVICCREQQGIVGGVKMDEPALCAVTDLGDLFMGQSNACHTEKRDFPQIYWQQLGGHLSRVKRGVAGVTWALGHDGKPYVYTGAYGGTFFKGAATCSFGIHNMTDSRLMHVYENQRWRLGRGYSSQSMGMSHFLPWSDVTGHVERTREGIKMASRQWAWRGDWGVDYTTQGGVDAEGWQYARRFQGKFYPKPRLRAYIRRRRWIRRCVIQTSGPWQEVTSPALVDIAIQLKPVSENSVKADCSKALETIDLKQNVAVWAVGANGDLLCRLAASAENPGGSSWQHVCVDRKFLSVSIDAYLRVWALSQDGGLWRQTDKDWLHMCPPPKTKLCQISVGNLQLWAVDSAEHLWYRPLEASSLADSWQRVAPRVRFVSVNAEDHVYIVQKQDDAQDSYVISRRVDTAPPKTSTIVCQQFTSEGFSTVSAGGWDRMKE